MHSKDFIFYCFWFTEKGTLRIRDRLEAVDENTFLIRMQPVRAFGKEAHTLLVSLEELQAIFSWVYKLDHLALYPSLREFSSHILQTKCDAPKDVIALLNLKELNIYSLQEDMMRTLHMTLGFMFDFPFALSFFRHLRQIPAYKKLSIPFFKDLLMLYAYRPVYMQCFYKKYRDMLRRLNKDFQPIAGYSVKQWTLKARMDKACELLRHPDFDASMAGIAELCGFVSQAYFTSKFKTHFKKSPLRWRKEQMQQGQIQNPTLSSEVSKISTETFHSLTPEIIDEHYTIPCDALS